MSEEPGKGEFWHWRAARGESADPEAERYSELVLGACIEVHRQLGSGHSESTYMRALCHELTLLGLPFQREVPVNIVYKELVVGQTRVDLIVAGCLTVELKSVAFISDAHVAQALSYLAATGLRLALVINFNVPLLKRGIKRVVRDPTN